MQRVADSSSFEVVLMPSPFPGMDPYLEDPPYWSDLHSMLISIMKIELKKRLPAGYTIWTDTYIWLHEPDAETRKGKPDVLVGGRLRARGERAVAILPAPASSILPAVRRESGKYLKIREARAERVITVVELISPTNKEPGDDRDAFQQVLHVRTRDEFVADLFKADIARDNGRGAGEFHAENRIEARRGAVIF